MATQFNPPDNEQFYIACGQPMENTLSKRAQVHKSFVKAGKPLISGAEYQEGSQISEKQSVKCNVFLSILVCSCE